MSNDHTPPNDIKKNLSSIFSRSEAGPSEYTRLLAPEPGNNGKARHSSRSSNEINQGNGPSARSTPDSQRRVGQIGDDERGIRRNYTADLEIEGESGLVSRDEGNNRDDRPGIMRKHSMNHVARKLRQRSKYYVPVTDWLPKYSWHLLTGDAVAGVSAMSYANGLATLSPIAGLWSAAIPSLIYGLLGTCRQLSLGPEASLSLLIGQMIRDAVHGDPHTTPAHPELEAAAIALVTTFQTGLITFALGLLRLGFLDVVLSRALLRGFITAVGIIIFIEQLIPLLGLTSILEHMHDTPTLPLAKLAFLLRHVKYANKTTTILSFTSLAVLIGARVGKQRIMKHPGAGWLKYVPEIFIVVVGTTALTGIFRWDEAGVDILGKVKGGGGMPFGWPLDKRRMKYFNYTLPTAFVSAVVGIVDSVVAARENGAKYGYPVAPNRELVALGAANLSAAFVTGTGSVPVFGSITRSRLNGSIGGRTQMSSMITSATIILSIYFLLPYLYFLPKSVLAAIIALVVYAILAEAPHEIIFFWKMGAWTDFLQMTGTFFLTLFFSIELGLVASVVFSLILVIQKSTQTRIKIIGRLPGTDEWVPVDEDEAAQEEIPGVLVVRIRESLSFANTGQLKERLRRLELYGAEKSHPSDEPRREHAKALILHMGDVEDIDASATQILLELTSAYVERGVGVHFAHLRTSQMHKFEVAGITDLLGPTHFHRDLRSAMLEIESLGYGTSLVSRFA
ncbi:endoplasmic reticulum protein [Tremella mesenterica]|uniref:Endoplasmic reticulum protein n=1 Tax=Tremella mesenterica TaxID=5217 RepID=A0A4Q1BR42_TREME|nr:endoplasmic reticulum protein [Tremella mesenterica]